MLPVNSAVNLLLARAAAAAGKQLLHRVVVTNFEGAIRAVRANLALSVIATRSGPIKSWELREFVSFRLMSPGQNGGLPFASGRPTTCQRLPGRSWTISCAPRSDDHHVHSQYEKARP